MRRLVYAPKTYVYVKDRSGTIHDLSAYVTAGSVTRRIDQVSSATITLRNPNKLFTAHIGEDGSMVRPFFHPMDPITIFLQRIKDRPVRVFTGFLDKTTYLQLFPGVITLEASCTLKRLLYTFFDPALPFTRSFLEEYGWKAGSDGTMISIQAFDEFLQDESNSFSAPQKKDHVDGSLANLLYAVLKHIGRWDTDTVYVEALSPDVFNRLTALAQEYAKNNKKSTDKVIELFGTLLSKGAYGNPSSGDQAGPVASTGTPTGDLKDPAKYVPIVIDTANKYNIPAKMVLAVMGIETDFSGNDDPGNPHYGWFQMQMENPPYAYGPFSKRTPTLQEAHDIGISTNAFCAAASGWARNNPGLRNNLLEWAMKVQGVNSSNNPRYPQEWDRYIKKAEQYITQYGRATQATASASSAVMAHTSTTDTNDAAQPDDSADTTTRSRTRGGTNKSSDKWVYPLDKRASSEGTVADHMSRPLGNWQSDNAVDLMASPGTKWVAVEDGKISASMGWGKSSGAGTVYGYRLHLEGKSGNVYFYQHGASNIAAQGKTVKQGDIIGEVGAFDNGIAPHLHFASKPPTNPEAVIKQGAITVGGADLTGGSNTTASTTTGNPVGAMFFGSIEVPGMVEQVASTLLGGEKSLLNDKPLLPFVQQICNASLRHFQSLPDGRFYAFFPDYFGEMNAHPPYWEIDDIEILDGNIYLNDDALVTHMYVVGDTTSTASGGSPFFARAVNSSGVVNVFNMFLAESVLNREDQRKEANKQAKKDKSPDWEKTNPVGMGTLMDRKEAADFLDRYGVRPMVEDMPMIRSPFYEMFLAYQKFLLSWSRQFATPFTFTFMPELYPGGKVGFPNHGLQMYIEEVNHSWDYENGFTTTATLSAPSQYTDSGMLPPNMVNAVIDTVKDK